MNTFLTVTGFVAIGVAFISHAQAETKLIFNADTGVEKTIVANPKIAAEAETAATEPALKPVLKSTLAEDTEADVEVNNEEPSPSEKARGGVLAEQDTEVDMQTDAESRIQNIGNVDSGVQATATTKIDMR